MTLIFKKTIYACYMSDYDWSVSFEKTFGKHYMKWKAFNQRLGRTLDDILSNVRFKHSESSYFAL